MFKLEWMSIWLRCRASGVDPGPIYSDGKVRLQNWCTYRCAENASYP